MSFIWRVRKAVDKHLWICSHGSGEIMIRGAYRCTWTDSVLIPAKNS